MYLIKIPRPCKFRVFNYTIIIYYKIKIYLNSKKDLSKLREAFYLVRLAGIEPAHPVPETGALSPEL